MYQIYFILEWHSTSFGLSFHPSSGVQDCTYSNRHMSDTAVCLLAGTRQQADSGMFDICLLLYVQSWTPDDGWKDSPKHVVSFQNKIIWHTGASSWFYYRNAQVTFGEKYKWLRPSLCHHYQSHYLHPLRPKYLLQQPIPKHLQPTFLCQFKRPNQKPIQKIQQNYMSA